MGHIEGCSPLCRPSCHCSCHWGHLPEATRKYLRKQAQRRG